MEFRHTPVMLDECIEGLSIKEDGTYIDCTVGGAGHSKEIAKRLNKGRLIAVDKDEEALSVAKERLSEFGEKVEFIHDDFKNLPLDLSAMNAPKVQGILIDLGVSSYQIDNAERGFSYINDARLDMRMDKSQVLSAYEIVNEYAEDELSRILFEFGEERFSRRIAKNIVKRRAEKKIETTLELERIVEESYPAEQRFKFGNPAKRTFQAIRIAVNGELTGLGEAIKELVNCLAPGGRIAIISFHSLEDRIVKTALKQLTGECTCPPDFPICVCGCKQTVKLINKKPILPSEREQKENKRSQSAKLRIAEKI